VAVAEKVGVIETTKEFLTHTPSAAIRLGRGLVGRLGKVALEGMTRLGIERPRLQGVERGGRP
jgi:hypothetical protein